MHKGIRRYYSLVFLFLLSFPIVEKSIHSWEHAHEKVCTITDKHFHAQEHSCSICDFTINDTNGLPATDVSFKSASRIFSFVAFTERAFLSHTFSDLPSRAPPLV